MVALTKDRTTPQAKGDTRNGPLAAAVTAFAGALLMRNAAGFIVPAIAASGLVGIGVCEKRVANEGADGEARVDYRPGKFRFANSAAADEITIAAIGQLCYAVDDQTVALTDGGGARSPAGIVDNIDDQGVWVCLDEHLTNIAAA